MRVAARGVAWMRWAAHAAVASTLLAGCAARRQRVAAPIHLRELAGSPYLVPGRAAVTDGTRQTAMVLLGVPAQRGAACAVTGPVFSLAPPSGPRSGAWTVTSPSLPGWQTPPPGVDLRAEWLGFVRSVAALQTAGCFPPGWNAQRAQELLAEAIPVPADEALVFAYSFTGTEAIDLFPGMQVQVEHSLYGMRRGQRELQSVEGDYEVVASGTGVALRRIRAVTLHQPATQDEIFRLDRLTSGTSRLRLFLQSVETGDVHRQPVLLAAGSAQALTVATHALQAPGSAGCVAVNGPDVRCIAFRSAVSLLLAIRVNGSVEYHAPGTALSQVLDEKHATLASTTLRRRLADGSYAPLLFVPTREAVSRVILQNRDEITAR